jgi:uncharacterized protein
MSTSATETAEAITLPATWHLEFLHAAGRAASRFLIALRDEQRLLASPCPRCGRVYVAPRDFCEECFVKTSDEWVAVGPVGEIRAFTIGYTELPGYPQTPYAIAYVQPDGADTAICNFVEGIELADPHAAAAALKLGTKLRAVYASTREARITDFHWEPAS